MWERRRNIAALVQSAFWLCLPFLKIGGVRAFSFDISGSKLHFFGSVVWLDEFYLLLLFSIFLVIFFIALTNILGRVWCGWICPQTVIPLVSNLISARIPGGKRTSVRTMVLAIFTGIVSLSIFWLFIEPAESISVLSTSRVALTLFLLTWGTIFADLTLLGTKFCTTVCPYSMLQSVLFDDDTIVVEYDKSRHPCLMCHACEKVCPSRIDIKNGLQRECIACTLCIDACIRVTTPKKISPFISYEGKIFKKKTVPLTIVTVAAFLAIIVAVYFKPPVNLTLRQDGIGTKGTRIISYTLRNNRGKETKCFFEFEGKVKGFGQKSVTLKPYATFSGKLLVLPSSKNAPGKITIVLMAAEERITREVRLL